MVVWYFGWEREDFHAPRGNQSLNFIVSEAEWGECYRYRSQVPLQLLSAKYIFTLYHFIPIRPTLRLISINKLASLIHTYVHVLNYVLSGSLTIITGLFVLLLTMCNVLATTSNIACLIIIIIILCDTFLLHSNQLKTKQPSLLRLIWSQTSMYFNRN